MIIIIIVVWFVYFQFECHFQEREFLLLLLLLLVQTKEERKKKKSATLESVWKFPELDFDASARLTFVAFMSGKAIKDSLN